MTPETLKAAITEAARFIAAAERVQMVAGDSQYGAAVNKAIIASMDLTCALAEMRKV